MPHMSPAGRRPGPAVQGYADYRYEILSERLLPFCRVNHVDILRRKELEWLNVQNRRHSNNRIGNGTNRRNESLKTTQRSSNGVRFPIALSNFSLFDRRRTKIPD